MNYTVEYFHSRVQTEIESWPDGILADRLGLSQEAFAELMGTTKSSISRLEAAGKHAPSLTTLKKYARAVGCHLEIKFIPEHA